MKLAFILFMIFISASAIRVVEKVNIDKNVSVCIMEQIELSEENRESYFPRMRNELLHGFIVQCVVDKSFRNKDSISLKPISTSNDSSNRKHTLRETK